MNRLYKAALQGKRIKAAGMSRSLAVILAALFLIAAIAPAQYVSAEEVAGENDWSVSFTEDKKMVSNFKTSDIDDKIYGMQPGDTATITLKLSNENEETTDWYMTNKVLRSLEGTTNDKETSGGAYTYRLVYTGPSGEERVLFDSDTVGGDEVSPAGEGLKEATDALEDYFYLDQLTTDQSGQIDLVVGLEGETQGNDYQDTLADLQMNFAVELSDEESTSTTSTSTQTTSTTSTTTTTTTTTGTTTTRTTVVKTGDENRILPYIFIAGGCGLFILFFALFCVVGRRKEKEGGKVS